MTELVWVAVPGGRAGPEGAVLRALVVPRIDGEGRLDEFAPGAWPSVCAGAVLTVEVAADQQTPAEPLIDAVRNAVQVDPQLWRSVFPPDLQVRPWRRPLAGALAPVVEQTTSHKTAILGVYQTSAKAWGDPTTIATTLRGAALGSARPLVVPDANRNRNTYTGERPDFHRVVSLLREHPAVLRALGMIVEFNLPTLGVLDKHTPGLVRVSCRLEGDYVEDITTVSPWTRYELRNNRFLPIPAPNSDVSGGLVDLGRAYWEFATFDVAGGADRVRDAVRTVREGDGPITLPALRSAGLSLLRRDRVVDYQSRNQIASANQAPDSLATTELTAETLMSGYRVDIRSSNDAWASVCRRRATYLASDDATVLVPEQEEEGQIKANGATVEHTDDADPTKRVLRADEVVTRWSGWSLVCPRTVGKATRNNRPSRSARFVHWRYTPVGLPELRFGQDYRMRLRVADIAGGGLGIDDPNVTEGQSREVFYGRHDPVPHPELVPPAGMVVPDGVDADGRPKSRVVPDALGPGGMLDVLVIRSDPNGGPTPDPTVYPRNDSRVLLPPPASFTLVEQHGRFDGVDSATCADWLRRSTSPAAYTVDGRYGWLPDPAAKGVAIQLHPAPGTALTERFIDDAWSLPSGTWPDFPAKRIELHSAEPGRQVLDWTDGAATAIVRLGPAEEAVIEISSSVTNDDVDKFEMRDWLGGRPRDDPDQDDALTALFDRVRDGLHPMVSPTRRISLVHAVRKPLRAPDGRLTATRPEGAAYADVHDVDHKNNKLLKIHPGSTAQVDLDATWTERIDDATADRAERVHSYTVDPAATELPTLRHEFGDTRHRRIIYTVTALSRFRQFFAPGMDADFAAATKFNVVSVPNSARPTPPIVLATTPSFRWEGTDLPDGWNRLVRTRRGGGIRVEIARPWHTTGEDERLAVVVWPTGLKVGMPDIVAPFLSVFGRDPIWGTSSLVADPETHMFAGWCADPAPVPLVETGHTVMAVPYETVFTDAESPRWFADIEIPWAAAASYCPFVRLALARYQPESLDGRKISTIVHTDMIRVLPDRTLTVTRDQNGLHVRLDGLGPVATQTNQVIATIERLPAGLAPAAVDLTVVPGNADGTPAWERVPGLTATGELNTDLPALVLPPQGPLRLVVREIERLPNLVEPGDTLDDELAQRTVYLDIITFG